jgi:serine/threonine protein kinase
MPPASVESLCNELARSRLLAADEIRKVRQAWLAEAGDKSGDLDQFGKWLVGRQYLTDYQLGVLLRGHGFRLFLNQYKLLERIAKGRMAGVYRAVHQLGQAVAIKILPPSKARDPRLLARFRREARIAVALQHPNVVRTFQAGVADGVYYLVMEHLEGETLRDMLRRRGKLPPAEASRLVHQALLGLQYLHEQGVVHRDLEPANLMLVPVPASAGQDTTLQAMVKLLDIGTGRTFFAEDVGPDGKPYEVTNDEDVLGTPDYMAPEQARDAHTADIRCDIYSLGCLLYHALAGQPPFPGANLVRKVVQHATEMPRPLKDLGVNVPDGLQQVLDRMLAKDPAQRYPVPAQAAKALAVFVGGAAPAATPVEPPALAYAKWLETDSAEADIDAVLAEVAEPEAGPARPMPSRKGARAAGARRQSERKVPTAGAAVAAEAVPEIEVVPVAVPRRVPEQPPPARPAPSRLNWLLVLVLLLAFGFLLLLCAGVLGGVLYWYFGSAHVPPDVAASCQLASSALLASWQLAATIRRDPLLP